MEHRRDIDGLRAIAVLAVIGFHGFPSAVPGGFVGVDVFFVISGFLITGLITRALGDGTFTFRGFYARRIRRIFPALIVVLAASLAIGWFVLLPDRYANLGEHVLGAAGFVANLVVWHEVGYFDVTAIEKPLLHLWSLGVEEQFYVVWPAVVVVLAKLRARLPIALAVIGIGSLVASIALEGTAAGFYLPVTRIWELALGGVLSFVPARNSPWLVAAGLALIAASIVVFDAGSPYPGWRPLVPTVGTGLAISGGEPRVLGASPPAKAMVAIGLVSYPLYLWHWVLLSFGHLVCRGEPPIAIRIALIAAAGALATLTYLAIERPLRRRRASLRQALSLVLALFAVAAAGRTVWQHDGFASRYPAAVRALLDYRFDYLAGAHAGECWLSRTDPVAGFAPSCGSTGVFVWGDSHAARLRPGIERAYPQLAIGSATRDLCVPSLHVDNATCVDSNRRVLDRLEHAPPATVVLFGQWSREADDTLDIAGRLAHAGSRVIVLGPAPHWTQNLPAAVYAGWQRASDQSLPRRLASDLDPAIAVIDQRMKALPWPTGVSYVSALDILCTADGCATYVPDSDQLTAYDYGHLTTEGAAFVARAMHL